MSRRIGWSLELEIRAYFAQDGEVQDDSRMLKKDGGTLVVFSHPNHELAIYGLLQRIKPHLIFLTDGGGPHRIHETEVGLNNIGLLDRATFLDHSEQSFYDALLRVDTGFFSHVAAEIQELMADLKPEQVLCDAVEFYNPVHDISLPIVSSIIQDRSRIYEVPLLYQKPGSKEEYGVQTAPPSRRYDRGEFTLTEAETESKFKALSETYLILKRTLGPVLLSSPEALKKETILEFEDPLRLPGADYVLRYDRRGQELKGAGQVKEVISHDVHFIGVASGLMKKES